MASLLTGLGIGLSFWIVVIPSLILLVRYPNNKTSNRTIELMEERNYLDKEKIDRLVEIRDALYHLST